MAGEEEREEVTKGDECDLGSPGTHNVATQNMAGVRRGRGCASGPGRRGPWRVLLPRTVAQSSGSHQKVGTRPGARLLTGPQDSLAVS